MALFKETPKQPQTLEAVILMKVKKDYICKMGRKYYTKAKIDPLKSRAHKKQFCLKQA